MAGTNDIAGNTGPTSLAWVEANVRTMVEAARANRVRVVLSAVTPAARYAWRPEIDSVAPIAELNAWLAAYARAQGWASSTTPLCSPTATTASGPSSAPTVSTPTPGPTP